jgi:phospholipid/cholesterol/gamma-HCH transport system substrate-binding protein
MADQLKNVMIGLFVLAAVVIIIFALMFLHPSVGDEMRVLRVRFANIDKVSVGTRVTFAGKPVGEVVAINELKDAINERQSHDGIIYVYELVLHVDSNVNVFNTDEISARTSGLLGEKSIAIIPLPSAHNEPIHIVNDEILFANEAGGVEDALKEFKQISEKIGVALDSLNIALTQINDEQIVKNVSHAIQNIDEITGALNNPVKISEIVGNTHLFTQKLLKTWDTVDNTMTELAAASHDIHSMTENGVKVVDNVQRGEGTVGRLLMTDQLYLKVNSLLSKGETVMNDINHYGLLFNMDKGWQRLRARRMNLMFALSSPIQFRNYFNEEIDQINTSLSRVYSVVESTGCTPCGDELFENREFQKVYAELLRRVQDTEEALKMYNQQLSDVNSKQTELSP